MRHTQQHKHSMGTPTDRSVRVVREFDAPRDLVWRAFTEPQLVSRWWGRGNPLDVEKFEFDQGGHWRFVEHHAGGTSGFEGRFREIRPNSLISQTFEWDGLPGHPNIATAEFSDLNGGKRTRLVSTTEFFNTAERDWMAQAGSEEGMAQSYAALDALLEELSSAPPP